MRTRAKTLTTRFLFLGFLVLGSLALATPAQVIIIRHAEKPDSGSELSKRGWRRAHALVGYFEKNPQVTQYGTPVAIYAMAPKEEGGSVRAIETVTPLADDLGLDLQEGFTKKEVDDVADEILNAAEYDGKMVLICWAHKPIPDLVEALGWDSGPDEWPDSVYDRTWVLNFSGDKVSSFEELPQHLLPGDD